MGSLGAPELLIILLVILFIFGGAKLPKLARSLGQAQSEFKKGIHDTSTASNATESDAPTPTDKPAATD